MLQGDYNVYQRERPVYETKFSQKNTTEMLPQTCPQSHIGTGDKDQTSIALDPSSMSPAYSNLIVGHGIRDST